MRDIALFLLGLCGLFQSLFAEEQSLEEMLSSLEIAAHLDRKIAQHLPMTYNHFLSSGYFTTHSARMSEEGEIGFGMASVPPYVNGNIRVQPFHHLELSANYRIFRGYKDPHLGSHGFGDYADRTANVKFAFFTPEQSSYRFPGLAVGIDDFMGTKKFKNYYIVGTHVFYDLGMELSFGWGTGTYTKGVTRGFFAGGNWFPWCDDNRWKRGLAFTLELDPTNYKKDPHPCKIHSDFPVNIGIKYNAFDLIELSGSYIRGNTFAVAGSLHYNWGKSGGFLPKIRDPLPFTAPVNQEPLGCSRPIDTMLQELYYTLNDQGFQLTQAWIENNYLWISLFNCCYRQEHIARMRLQHILAALLPTNMDKVMIILESYGLPCQSYVYDREILLSYFNHTIGPYEFDLLSTRQEAISPPDSAQLIFQRKNELWRFKVSPRLETFLGNAKGKFKYDAGIKGFIDGFLPYSWYYEIQASYTLLSSIHHLSDRDFFHPSQLPNVATDFIRYRQGGAFTWDHLYTQKSCNWGKGIFTRAALGYFQVNYGGIAGEVLWYPACSCMALGVEGAIVKKRNYSGLGFQSRLRHFEGEKPIFRKYSTLQQYFFNIYIDFPASHFFTRLSIGQFLAHDKGGRLEVTRYFDNGLRLTGWITLTNAFDKIHGENYYDRGVAIEVPLDFFFQRSSRRVWNYAMAAWLRDAGYATSTGHTLFETINRERRW